MSSILYRSVKSARMVQNDINAQENQVPHLAYPPYAKSMNRFQQRACTNDVVPCTRNRQDIMVFHALNPSASTSSGTPEAPTNFLQGHTSSFGLKLNSRNDVPVDEYHSYIGMPNLQVQTSLSSNYGDPRPGGRYGLGDENVLQPVNSQVLNENQTDLKESEDQFWKFENQFHVWKSGQVKCSLCPQLLDERKGTCDECNNRVNKVKSIFSHIQSLPSPSSRHGRPQESSGTREQEIASASYVAQTWDLHDHENYQGRMVLASADNCCDNGVNEEGSYTSVGDYYDSDYDEESETHNKPNGKLKKSPKPPKLQMQSKEPGLNAKANESELLTSSQGSRNKFKTLPTAGKTGEHPIPLIRDGKSVKPVGKTTREIAVFKCPLCAKVFCQPAVLDYHLYKFHSGTWPFKCKDCKGRSFAYWKTYVIHRSIHKGRNHRMCEYCALDFGEDENRYVNHLKCHGLPTWKCKYCPTEFPSQHKLDGHFIQEHVERNPLSCLQKECQLTFKSYSLLREHIKVVHQVDKPDDTLSTPALFPKVNTPVDVYTEVVVKIPCEICGVKQETVSDLENHMKTLHENISTVICPRCNKLVDICWMGSHECKKESSKQLKCGICSKRFAEMKLLVAHQVEHQIVMRSLGNFSTSSERAIDGCLSTPETPDFQDDHGKLLVTPKSEKSERASNVRGDGRKRRKFPLEEKKQVPQAFKKTKKDPTLNLPTGCPLCPSKCNPEDLKSWVELHEKGHRPTNPYPCPVPTCRMRFSESYYATSHYRFVHLALKEVIASLQGDVIGP